MKTTKYAVRDVTEKITVFAKVLVNTHLTTNITIAHGSCEIEIEQELYDAINTPGGTDYIDDDDAFEAIVTSKESLLKTECFGDKLDDWENNKDYREIFFRFSFGKLSHTLAELND